MKYLLDFIDQKSITQSEIYPHLKCETTQAEILKLLSTRYISGSEDGIVFEILQSIYGEDDYKFLDHLKDVKVLLELGWLTQSSFAPLKVNDLSELELLNTAIALTPAFLRLVEIGSLEMELPDIKPYEDHLEYLQDQFLRVELYAQMSMIRHSVHESSLGIDRIQNKLELLEKRILDRLSQTEQEIILDKYIKQKKFDKNEEIIFLALLKEEYNAAESSLREMNSLIDLVSLDEYDRIKNRSLLEEGARLISEEIIDYEEMLNPFGGITRAFYIVDSVLQNIIHPQKKKKVQKLKLNNLIKEQDMFELIDPQTSLEDVVLHPKTVETLESLMRQMDKEVVARLVKWGIKDKKATLDARIIFYGAPGTGKTMTSHSLAKSLKRQILAFDCSKILSMYVGESEKNVRKIFDTYYELTQKTKTEPILLLNEADQFLGARSSGVTSGADQMHNQMQNIFLEQIENFKGILIATTNLLENIDSAFSRRFNYKIEFKKPTLDQRVLLWEKMLPQNAPFEKNFDIKKLATYDLTGGQINLVVKNTAFVVATHEEPLFSMKEFIQEIDKEKKGSFDSEKLMGFIN
ncbi:MAG: AAA family ATPase [Helicobacteraceae bacterium]|nr:AAA family ATPase [Helicobacteraceae bacterium]